MKVSRVSSPPISRAFVSLKTPSFFFSMHEKVSLKNPYSTRLMLIWRFAVRAESSTESSIHASYSSPVLPLSHRSLRVGVSRGTNWFSRKLKNFLSLSLSRSFLAGPKLALLFIFFAMWERARELWIWYATQMNEFTFRIPFRSAKYSPTLSQTFEEMKIYSPWRREIEEMFVHYDISIYCARSVPAMLFHCIFLYTYLFYLLNWKTSWSRSRVHEISLFYFTCCSCVYFREDFMCFQPYLDVRNICVEQFYVRKASKKTGYRARNCWSKNLPCSHELSEWHTLSMHHLCTCNLLAPFTAQKSKLLFHFSAKCPKKGILTVYSTSVVTSLLWGFFSGH